MATLDQLVTQYSKKPTPQRKKDDGSFLDWIGAATKSGLDKVKDLTEGSVEQVTSGKAFTDIPRNVGRRLGLVSKAAVGDVPLVREWLPKAVQEMVPETLGEAAAFGVPRLFRDFYLGGKLFKALPVTQKAITASSKLPGILGKAAPAAIETAENIGKGALFGAATAGTSKPKEIAKTAAGVGAFTGVAPWAVKAVAKGVPAGFKLAGKGLEKAGLGAVPRTVRSLAERAGRAMGVRSAIYPGMEDAVLKRQATMAEMNLNTEVFLDKFKKQFPDETLRKAVPFIREGIQVPKSFNVGDDVVNLVQTVSKEGLDETTKQAMNVVDKFYRVGYKQMNKYAKAINPKAPEIPFTENYVNRLWKNFNNLDGDVQRRVIKWFRTKNPNSLKRTYTTMAEAAEKFGLEPVTTDIVDLMRIYQNNLTNMKANAQFITSLKDMVKGNLRATGKRLIRPYDRKTSKGLYRSDHPVLVKAFGKGKDSVLVSKELEPTIKALFGRTETSAAGRMYDAGVQVFKYNNLAFSGFHPMVLTESAALNDTLRAANFNPAKLYNAIAKGETYVLANPDLTRKAIRAGVLVGEPIDVARNYLTDFLYQLEGTLGKSKLPVTAYRKAIEAQSNLLWGYLNPSYKVQAFDILTKQDMKNPKIADVPARQEERAVAQWVNNSFGGQSWEMLGKSPEWKKYMSRIFLSPDWLTSTNKQLLNVFGVGETNNAVQNEIVQELGINFWKRAAVVYALATNKLNRAVSEFIYGEPRDMWDNPPGKKGDVLLYKDPVTGAEKYGRIAKQLKDPIELVYSSTSSETGLGGAVESGTKKILGKLSPGINVPSVFLQGKTLGGYETELSRMIEQQKPGTTPRRFLEVAKMLLPYSMRDVASDEELGLLSFILPMSKGMTAGRARKMMMNTLQGAIKRAEAAIKVGKMSPEEAEENLLNRSEKLKIIALAKAANDNGLDAEYIWERAKSRVKGDLTLENRREARGFLRKLYDKPQSYQRDFLKKQPKGVQEQFGKILKERRDVQRKKRSTANALERLRRKYEQDKPTLLQLLP